MTEFGKFMNLFDCLGIKYTTKDFKDGYSIEISDEHIYQSYFNSISIIFDRDGKFVEFEAYGD